MEDCNLNQAHFSGMSDGQIIAELSKQNADLHNQIKNLALMARGKMKTDITGYYPGDDLYQIVAEFIIEKRKEPEEMK